MRPDVVAPIRPVPPFPSPIGGNRGPFVRSHRIRYPTNRSGGARRYSYLIDLDGQTLVAVTHSVGDTDHERDEAVLDRMIERLELRPDDA